MNSCSKVYNAGGERKGAGFVVVVVVHVLEAGGQKEAGVGGWSQHCSLVPLTQACFL